jgi:hypothetical protein
VFWVKGVLKVQVTARGGEGGLALANLVHVKAMEAWRKVVHYRSNVNLIPHILAQPDFSHGIALDILELSAEAFIIVLDILELSAGVFITPSYQIAWGVSVMTEVTTINTRTPRVPNNNWRFIFSTS